MPVPMHKNTIDCLDQPQGGPIVGVQGKELTFSIPPGLQIGMNICSPKGIDCLLRVTDHEQSRLRAVQVNATEHPVLDLIRVLELINQCNGITLSNQFCQSTTVWPL